MIQEEGEQDREELEEIEELEEENMENNNSMMDGGQQNYDDEENENENEIIEEIEQEVEEDQNEEDQDQDQDQEADQSLNATATTAATLSADDADFIVCGSCGMKFKLTSILEFIQHKITKCNNSVAAAAAAQAAAQIASAKAQAQVQAQGQVQAQLQAAKSTPDSPAVAPAPTKPDTPYCYKCFDGKMFSDPIQLIEHCETVHGMNICKKFYVNKSGVMTSQKPTGTPNSTSVSA